MRYLAGLFLIVLSTALQAQTVTTSPSNLTWKNVLPFDTASQKFALSNTSTSSIICVLSGVKAPFYLVGDSTFTLAPLATDSITILFSPTDIRGSAFLDSLVVITEGGPPFSHVLLNGTAKQFNNGTVNLSSTFLDFGTIIVGARDTLAVVATNGGKSNLVVSANLEGSVYDHASLRLLTKSTDVPAGKSLALKVQFAPFDSGFFSDTLIILTNDTAHPKMRVPIQGRAVRETGTVSLTPASLDFGKILVGAQDTLDVKASNVGQTKLVVSASVGGGHGFSLLGNYFSDTVTVEDSLVIRIVFKPVKTAGVYYDTVIVLTNDTLRSTIRIPVRGEGVQPLDGVVTMPAEAFSVQPLFAHNDLFVHTSSAEMVELFIVDLLGREWVKTRVPGGDSRVNIASLRNGPYLCVVRGPSGVRSVRFVIEK